MRETGWPLSQHPALTLAWQALRISWLSKILSNYSWGVEGTPRCAVILFLWWIKAWQIICVGWKLNFRKRLATLKKLKPISSVISWQVATQKVEIGINLIFTALIIMQFKKSKPFDCLLLERWLRPAPVMEVTQIIHQDAEKYKAQGACCSDTRCFEWWETRERRFSFQAKTTQEVHL